MTAGCGYACGLWLTVVENVAAAGAKARPMLSHGWLSKNLTVSGSRDCALSRTAFKCIAGRVQAQRNDWVLIVFFGYS